jgi:hypothetical protein
MDQPWLNHVDYTGLELVLFLTGCSMWVFVYLIYVRNVRRNSFFEMPLVAAVSNFAWETLWTFEFQTNMGRLCQWLYAAWFVVDLYLIAAAWRLSSSYFATPLTKLFSRHVFLSCLIFFSAFYYFFTEQGLDTPIGARSAYLCQLILSLSYVIFIVQRRCVHGFSALAAWLRTYATAMISVMMVSHYPEDRWLHVLCVSSFIVDHAYIGMYYAIKRQLVVVRGEHSLATAVAPGVA